MKTNPSSEQAADLLPTHAPLPPLLSLCEDMQVLVQVPTQASDGLRLRVLGVEKARCAGVKHTGSDCDTAWRGKLRGKRDGCLRWA